MSTIEILQAAKALPLDERIRLAQDLWDDIADHGEDPLLSPEQAAELDRRLAEFEKNPHDGISFAEIKTELRQRYGWS